MIWHDRVEGLWLPMSCSRTNLGEVFYHFTNDITPKQDWEQHETKQLEILKPSDLQQKHLAILIDSNDWLYIDGNLQKDNSS